MGEAKKKSKEKIVFMRREWKEKQRMFRHELALSKKHCKKYRKSKIAWKNKAIILEKLLSLVLTTSQLTPASARAIIREVNQYGLPTTYLMKNKVFRELAKKCNAMRD